MGIINLTQCLSVTFGYSARIGVEPVVLQPPSEKKYNLKQLCREV